MASHARGKRRFRPLSALLSLVMLAIVGLFLVLAFFAATTTLAWRHVIGQQTAVRVTDCTSGGRGGDYCSGTTLGAHPVGVDRLTYAPDSIGSVRRVWVFAGDAVVGTPWGWLVVDVVVVALVAVGVAVFVSARRRRRAS